MTPEERRRRMAELCDRAKELLADDQAPAATVPAPPAGAPTPPPAWQDTDRDPTGGTAL